MEKVTENLLLEGARAGDAVCFAELYRRHRPALLSTARRFGAADMAEDLVADSVASVWRNLCVGLGPRTSFLAYTRTAIRNGFLNEVRRTQGRIDDNLMGDLSSLPEEVLPNPYPAPEATTMAASTRDELEHALAALHPRWSYVLVRIYLEDATWEQVACELGLQVAATRQLGFRARRGLHKMLVSKNVEFFAEC